MKHIDVIAQYCNILAVKADKAVWYVDGGYKYADIYDAEEGGWTSYSCNSAEEFELFCEGVVEEDDEEEGYFPDDVDECGYDPYMGCYTDDC